MCGICGVFGEGGSTRVGAMVDALHHRGPDDRGVFADQKISLGMTRLAVIDLGPGGHQPMASADGRIWIVYNGETYNYASERAALEAEGQRFRSSSDTEVVLRLYERYGDAFLERLRGMFALAIYDRRDGPGRERLLLARDHFGIKPLVYARLGSRLVFASEVRALLASGLIRPELDLEGLRLLLTHGSVTQPRTILRGVFMLPPAHRMIVDARGQRLERYWRLRTDVFPELGRAAYADQVAAVAEALRESVRLQLVSDVPLGAFLSGGVDSSLLVALMARLLQRPLRTFSVGFDSEGRHLDETDDALEISRFIGTDHTRVSVSGAEVARDVERIAWGLDQPSVDGVNTYFVAKAARTAVTVAISGNGGDELFAGYPWFVFMARDAERRKVNPWEAAARSVVARAARIRVLDPLLQTEVGPVIQRTRSLAGFVSRYANTYQVFGAAGTARLLAKGIRAKARCGQSLNHDLAGTDELPHGTPLQRVTALTLRGYNGNQLLRDIDAMSMHHSLEVRVPYLDPVVVHTALSVADASKLGPLTGLPEGGYTYRESGAKRILFDAGRGVLPPDLDRQEKRGFGMPFESWLQGPLREVLRDALSDDQTRRRGLFTVEEVRRVREDALAGRGVWTRPWLLLVIELWCRQVLDRPWSDQERPEPSTGNPFSATVSDQWLRAHH